MSGEKLVNAALKFLEKRLGMVSLQITKSIDSLGSDLARSADVQARSLAGLSAQFEKATQRMEKPTFDVEVDLDPLLEEIKALTEEVKMLDKGDENEMERTEALLQAILTAVNKNEPKDFPIDALDAVFKGLKPKESVKFDDNQMKGLMAALTNNAQASITTSAGVLEARAVALANVTMAVANTEYSYTFPSNTVAFELRTRADDVPLFVSYVTGKLPTSGDGSAYFTVPAYYIEKTAGLDWGGKTIYLQTASASQILEIIVYTA